jgi:hypothetical protein
MAGQLSPERLAHSARVLAERSATELENGEGDRNRQIMLEGTPGGSSIGSQGRGACNAAPFPHPPSG